MACIIYNVFTVFYSVKLQYVLPSYYTTMQPMNGLDTKRWAHQEEDLMIIHGNILRLNVFILKIPDSSLVTE